MDKLLKWIPVCLGLWCLVGLILAPIVGRIMHNVAKNYPEVPDDQRNDI